MMERNPGDIDALIREEKRLTAVETQNEAWADAIACGIEPEIMAEATLSTALGELARACGEESALAMLERMREKVVSGAFEPDLIRH